LEPAASTLRIAPEIRDAPGMRDIGDLRVVARDLTAAVRAPDLGALVFAVLAFAGLDFARLDFAVLAFAVLVFAVLALAVLALAVLALLTGLDVFAPDRAAVERVFEAPAVWT